MELDLFGQVVEAAPSPAPAIVRPKLAAPPPEQPDAAAVPITPYHAIKERSFIGQPDITWIIHD